MRRKYEDGLKNAVTIFVIMAVMVLILTGIAIEIADSDNSVHVKNFLQDTCQADSIVSLNRDSLSAFMSVIIEANQTLVKDPRDCHWLLLTEIFEPGYIHKSDNKIVYERPTKESVLIWIPTSSEIFDTIQIGSNIPRQDFYIGNNLYNGDLEHIKIRVAGKEDRGF